MGLSKYLETVPRGSFQMLRNSLGPIYGVAFVQRSSNDKGHSNSHSARKILHLFQIIKLPTTLHAVPFTNNGWE